MKAPENLGKFEKIQKMWVDYQKVFINKEKFR